jgi:hypothetical protein
LARKTEVLGENLPQCHFVHHKSHILPGREPGPRWEKYGDLYALRFFNCNANISECNKHEQVNELTSKITLAQDMVIFSLRALRKCQHFFPIPSNLIHNLHIYRKKYFQDTFFRQTWNINDFPCLHSAVNSFTFPRASKLPISSLEYEHHIIETHVLFKIPFASLRMMIGHYLRNAPVTSSVSCL